MSFAAGLSVGMVVGLGAGLIAGRTGAANAVERAARDRGIIARDSDGNPVDINTFLQTAIKASRVGNNQYLRIAFILGGLALLVAVAMYLSMSGTI